MEDDAAKLGMISCGVPPPNGGNAIGGAAVATALDEEKICPGKIGGGGGG